MQESGKDLLNIVHSRSPVSQTYFRSATELKWGDTHRALAGGVCGRGHL